VYENGGPEVMRWEEFDPGDPGPGQLRLRHRAVAVNYRDIYVRTGLHAVKLPTGLGIEGAGVVEAIGPDVAGFRVGDRVACAGGPDNAYAEHRIVPAGRTLKLPDAIDDRTAAAMMVRGMTARYLLFATYPVKQGDAILVHSAAGGVGLILCQWARHIGATVIGTVGSPDKAAVARAAGCAYPIVRTGEDFVARVRGITGGRGVDVVYDSVGRDTFEGSLHCLRPRGLLASFGEASGDPDPVPPRRLGQMGSLFLTHPSLPHYTATRAELEETAADLFRVVADGTVKIDITRTYALKDAAQAHRDMETGRTTGSPVLVV
jgi:NADPH2:quinone reductase